MGEKPTELIVPDAEWVCGYYWQCVLVLDEEYFWKI